MRPNRVTRVLAGCFLICTAGRIFAIQAAAEKQPPAVSAPPSAEVLRPVEESLQSLRTSLASVQSLPHLQTRDGELLLADVAIFEKAAAWMLRFREFPKPESIDQLRNVIRKGEARLKLLASNAADWPLKTGTTIRGYVSQVDGSVQPYAVTLPAGVNPAENRRWPLHVVLHGRADQMNEVNFIHRMDEKPLRVLEGQPLPSWIQLDVYGRGNNAYRWAGETDVFEAIADVKRRFRIDEDRITLHGFSMGGAGAWHLGLHHPALWSSVGPGAGFVDFYRYQKKDPDNPEQRLPLYQHRTLSIYDSVRYALNAANVPVCTYGGENDPQLLASTTMAEAASALDVSMKVIVGPGMGHAFDPESQKQFMAFHLEQSLSGRPKAGQRKAIRFSTQTLRYHQCDWIAIEEMDTVYEPAQVEATLTETGDVDIQTSGVRALRVMRDAGAMVTIDGTPLDCRTAADGLLPDVYYVRTADGWELLDYEDSRSFADNPERVKRHGLQGPIDDAFMSSFVCVRGTGTPWNAQVGDWSAWSLKRFQQEFAQWMRGDIRIVSDTDVTEDVLARNHLVLFGDPGSNSVLRKVVDRLPVRWTQDSIQVNGKEFSSENHGLVMIFPNPLNPAKYLVLNSGHTFHEKDFRASNAWLFPRLGDVAVLKLSGNHSEFDEQTVWADLFDARWKLTAQP